MTSRIKYLEDGTFADEVRKHFVFLETEFEMPFSGLRVVDDDSRDRAIVASYGNDNGRVQIHWNELELSIAVVIRLNTDSVPRKQRSVILDSFVEFITNGNCKPVVPQFNYGMGVDATMKKRNVVFREGLGVVLIAVAERLQHFMKDILDAKSEVIMGYHEWFDKGGGSVPVRSRGMIRRRRAQPEG